MKPARQLASAVVALSALAVACCSPDDGATAGASFPNSRVAFPRTGRTLGYVANRYSDTVSVVDLGTLTVLGEVPVGINPIEIDGPRQVALDVSRGVAYVLMSYPLSVVGAHAVAHGALPPFGVVRALSLLDLTPLGDLAVDRRAAALALANDHGLLAVGHFDEDLALLPADLESRRANVVLIDPPWGLADGTASVRKGPACVAPMDLAFGKDRTRVYMACTGEDALGVIDTASATVLIRVPAGDGAVNKPTAVTIDPTGTQVLLSNELTSQVVAFAADDGAAKLLSSVELPGIPGPVAFPSADEWLVPLRSPNGAVRVDAGTGAVRAQKTYRDDECENPHAATIAADGRLFLVCEGDHYGLGAIVWLDAGTLEIRGRVDVGIYPDRVAVLEPRATMSGAGTSPP